MTRSSAQLKALAGWFAAGAEVQRAAKLLSDSAFKLFVWLCLHAERDRGSLDITNTDLAAALSKTEREIGASIDELVDAGVCSRGPANRLVIGDLFWPYTRIEESAYVQEAEHYVAEVKRIFLSQACVSSAFTPADHRIAEAWRRRGVTLECAERAILLGCLRKYVTLLNQGSGTPITTLAYFRALIDEVGQISATRDYWQYVAVRLVDFDRRWRQRKPADCQNSAPKETK